MLLSGNELISGSYNGRVVETVEEIVKVVSTNLKRLRTERDISVSELARNSGIGRGTLTSLEAGRGNPTIETLWALAGALDVPFGELASKGAETSPEVVRSAQGMRVPGSGAEVRLVERLPGRRLLEVYEMSLAPGDRREAVAHTAGVVEHVFVTRGTFLTGPVIDTVELGPGDSTHFAGDLPHVYAARGDETVHALVLVDYPASLSPEDGRTSSLAYDGSTRAYSTPPESEALGHVRGVIERAWVEVMNGLEVKRSIFGTDPFKTREIYRLVSRHREVLLGEGRFGKNINSFVVTDGAEVSLVSFPKNLGLPSRYSTGQKATGQAGSPVVLGPESYPRSSTAIERAGYLCGFADALAGKTLSEQEIELLENIAREPARTTGTLAAEILTQSGLPTVQGGVLRPDGTAEHDVEVTMPRTVPSYATEPQFEDRIDVHSYDLFEAVHPAYAAQCTALAYAARRLLKDFDTEDLPCVDVGTGPGLSLLMLLELLPNLKVRAVEPSPAAFARLQRNIAGEARVQAEQTDFLDLQSTSKVPLITSIGSSHHLDTYLFLRKAYELLGEGGYLLVADEFTSPYRTIAERDHSLIRHHWTYMLALMVEIPDDVRDTLSLDEQELVNRLRNDLPLAVSYARENKLEFASRRLRELLERVHRLTRSPEISHPLVAFYRNQVLELEALVAGLDYEVERKTYPERFESLARSAGFAILDHNRIYATEGSRDTDAGTHVFVLEKARA